MRPEFAVHRLNAEGIERAGLIAQAFSDLLSKIEVEATGLDVAGNAKSPDPRLMAIVRTKLEEACFFAKKAMASQASHQEPSQ